MVFDRLPDTIKDSRFMVITLIRKFTQQYTYSLFLLCFHTLHMHSVSEQ